MSRDTRGAKILFLNYVRRDGNFDSVLIFKKIILISLQDSAVPSLISHGRLAL